MNASKAGVKRVVLRLGDAARMATIKSRLDRFSGTDGHLVSTEYMNTRNAGRIEVWQWYVQSLVIWGGHCQCG